ncbi:hypothetical protein GQ457_03G020170 [Hibiscus cannabinus]
MARCKNAPETTGRANPAVQIHYFEDNDAKARHQALKGRQTLAEKGFVFKGTRKEGFPPSVVATIAMHKWEKYVMHPGSVDPNQKPINVTLVQEFYVYLTSPTQSSVYVRGEQIQFTAAKINKFYGLQNTADNHSKFKKGRLGITDDSIPSLIGFDEATTSKQPTRGARTIAAAKLAALITMAATTIDQLEGLKTDLRTYFNYVQERDQVIKANFNEMLPQSSLNFPSFPQDLLKPAETKMPEQQPAQPTAEHATNQPQEKPFGSDSTSSSPTPPDATPQHNSPPTQRRKGKDPTNTPATPAMEIDSEETAAFEKEEETQRTPTPPVAPTSVRRRTKRTSGRVLVEDIEEEVQSGAGEEDQPMIIPPTHQTSIKLKATKRARRATTK